MIFRIHGKIITVHPREIAANGKISIFLSNYFYHEVV